MVRYHPLSPMGLELRKLPDAANEVLDHVSQWVDDYRGDIRDGLNVGNSIETRLCALSAHLLDLLQQATEDRESWSDTADSFRDRLLQIERIASGGSAKNR